MLKLLISECPEIRKRRWFLQQKSSGGGVVVVVVTPHPFTVAREWNSNQGAERGYIHILVFSAAI